MTMKYIIGFDVGNTNTVIGIFLPEKNNPEISFRIVTENRTTVDEVDMKIGHMMKSHCVMWSEIDCIVYSSVVPSVDNVFFSLFERYKIHFLNVDINTKTGLIFKYDKPEDIGADRIVNAVSGYQAYGVNENIIIIDFGTATTFCVVLKEGIYQGGIIAPGLNMAMEALSRNTAKLPKISFKRPPFVIGTSTTSSIQSGFYFGWTAMVEGVIGMIKKQLNKEFRIILTGGHASLLAKGLSMKVEVDDNLTLKGLKIIYDKNCCG